MHIRKHSLIALTCLTVLFTGLALAEKGGKGGKGGGGGTAPYEVIDLLGLAGGPGGELQSASVALNDPDSEGNLIVAGESYANGEWRPVAWLVGGDASFTIENLGVPISSDGRESVNDDGVILVQSLLKSEEAPEGISYAMVPTASGYDQRELPSAGGVTSYPQAINNHGVIAGYIIFDDGTERYGAGALWLLDEQGTPGNPISLGSFIPSDISDTGVMTGQAAEAPGAAVARFDDNDALQIDSLGTLPGYTHSQANAISPNGNWVVGYARDVEGNNGPQGFVWSAQTGMVGVGSFGGGHSSANGVNDYGEVVGTSDTRGGNQTAFFWNKGQLFDLNALVDDKRHLEGAADINNAGQIVGSLRISRPVSEIHGFLLNPNLPKQ